MTARSGYPQQNIEYIKEEYNELDRIPTGNAPATGYFMESEISRSIGDDG